MPAEKQRTEYIGMRVTPAEKEQIRKKASMLGLSLTAFILAECLGEQIGQTIIDGFDKRCKNG